MISQIKLITYTVVALIIGAAFGFIDDTVGAARMNGVEAVVENVNNGQHPSTGYSGCSRKACQTRVRPPPGPGTG